MKGWRRSVLSLSYSDLGQRRPARPLVLALLADGTSTRDLRLALMITEKDA